jgi:uncharacterized OsmC-like protein
MKTTTENKGIINGVNVDMLFDTIETIKKEPDLAKFRFRVKNRWIRAGHNRTTIKEFFGVQKVIEHENPFELDAGEHFVLLSKDEGPNPVEYLLTALAGCLTSSLIYHAAAKGLEVRGVESRLEGEIDLRGFLGIDPNVPVGYKNIRVRFTIDADIPNEQKEELIRTAQKYSPVFNSILHETPVEVQLEK